MTASPDGQEPGSTAGDLLVASGGGHIHELALLRDRFDPPAAGVHWVTYDTPDAMARVGDDPVTICHHPTSRHLGNAARNVRLASGLLRELAPRRVISTGAGVAVPFLGAAAAMGIEAHYIESATRTDGPSLAGRMLQRIPRVNLHTQHPTWATGRWRHGGSVFDQFQVARTNVAAGPPDRPLRIVVSLGTSAFPFDRLVAAIARVTTEQDSVFAQLGSTITAPPHWETTTTVPPSQLMDRIENADVIVCHAGVGLILTTLGAGRMPVVEPRLRQHGEHVDDHQQQIATLLTERGLVVSIGERDLPRHVLLDLADRRITSDLDRAPAFHLPTTTR